MSSEKDGLDEQSLAVNQLIAEFMSRSDAGENLDVDQFIKEHPEHAVELKQHFANVDLLEDIKETDFPGNAETILKPDIPSEQSTDDATENTLVRGSTDSETSVTREFKEKSTSSATSLEIPETFGRYAIQKVLGQGAMGAVYLARDTQLDRDVALKIPKFGDGNGVDDEELLERFYREARASATLRSSNICPVYDVGEIEGQHYITMAYIEGRPLKDFTKSKKKHSEKQIITTIRKLAVGLEQAHKIGVIHRDLKPANIMVDQQGEPVVMDFGLARRSASDDVQVTQSGAILGTPAYMAPEQVAGDQAAIDHQVDIYALGIIMYELITGEMPFKGNLMAILQQIALNNPTKPTDLRPDIDPRLEKICLKMMAGDQRKRYQSMTDVANDLQEVLRNPGKRQKKEQSKKTGPKPTSIPTAHEESNPALISVAQPKSYAEQLRKKKSSKSSTKLPQTSSADANGISKKKYLIAGGVGGLILLLGIIILVRIGKYDVQITLDDPTITLSVDGEEVIIDNDGKVIKLSAGEHKLKLEKDGLITHVEEFTVSKNGKTAIRAVVVRNKLDALLNGEEPAAIEERMTGGPVENSGPETITPDEGTSSQLKQAENSHSLLFDGQDDYVELHLSDSLKDRLSKEKPVTVEAWVWSANKAKKRQFIFNSGVSTRLEILREGEDFGEYLANTWTAYRINHKGVWDRVVSSKITPSGKWTHLAVVWQASPDGYKSTIYVNGNSSELERNHKAGLTQSPPEMEAILGAAPGTDGHSVHSHFEGKIRDFRITDAARYQEDFKPEQNLAADKQTALLFKMNEGSGNILKDSSDNGHHGKIIGAKWVRNQKNSSSESNSSNLDFALKFEGNSNRVELPDLNISNDQPFTIELTAHTYADETVQQAWIWDMNSFALAQLGGPSWNAGIRHVDSQKIMDHRYYSDVKRVKLAGVYDQNRITLYVNGKKISRKMEIHVGKNRDVEPQPFLPFIPLKENRTYMLGASIHRSRGFNGLIDEIRVSNFARYQNDYSPVDRFEVDAHTVALYHCDEGAGDILKDFSGNGHHGKIIGAKWVGTSATDAASGSESSVHHALEFDGNSKVSVPMTNWAERDELTYEAFVQVPEESDQGNKIPYLVNQTFTGALIYRPKGWEFMVNREGEKGVSSCVSKSPPVPGRWVHLAGVIKQQSIQLFVDGEPMEPVQLPDKINAESGTQVHIGSNFSGMLRGVKISKTARYDKRFDPPQKFSADGDTLALYQFDEGSSEILNDSSGNGYHGKINGAKWVTLEQFSSQQRSFSLSTDPRTLNSENMNWEFKDETLIGQGTATNGNYKWIAAEFSNEIQGDYDIDFEFKQSAFSPIQVDFPLGDGQAIRVHIGGAGSALMQIDGNEDRDAAEEFRNDDVKLNYGKWQHLAGKVRHHGENVDIDVSLDGAHIGRFSGERSRISLPSWNTIRPTTVKFSGHGDLSKAKIEVRGKVRLHP